ncbi:triose-phosphate isomerase [Kineococcus sp. NBC_00420]|uniref:triose-phosphate isomerase family protein n=1 Tax=Kineococcus sp. NBC_00420 TaxID=2903564 RepID=UPI002E235D85
MTTRPRPLVGVSLKMYFSLARTRSYLADVATLGRDVAGSGVDAFVIPDFLNITTGIDLLRGTGIAVGAQDASWEDFGALTGEVSPAALREAGARFVEIGHAERRRMFAEDDIVTARKAAAAARNGLVPLICIGENVRIDVPDAARTTISQVLAALEDVPSEAEVVIGYEPNWAIGQTEPAPPEHVVGVTTRLRDALAHRRGVSRILYGGSAGPGMFTDVAEGVDGLFLGRFAHDVANFRLVIQEIADHPLNAHHTDTDDEPADRA